MITFWVRLRQEGHDGDWQPYEKVQANSGSRKRLRATARDDGEPLSGSSIGQAGRAERGDRTLRPDSLTTSPICAIIGSASAAIVMSGFAPGRMVERLSAPFISRRSISAFTLPMLRRLKPNDAGDARS
jgi:hypothetical protein